MVRKLLVVSIFVFVLLTYFLADVFAGDYLALQGNVQQAGVNLASGNLTVVVYDAYTGGNIIYNSTTNFNGAIYNGKYDVLLGNGSNALNLAFGGIYYLELYVNNEPFTFNGSSRQTFQAGVGKINASYINPRQINSSHLELNIDLSNATKILASAVNKTTGQNWTNLLLDNILDTIYNWVWGVNTTSNLQNILNSTGIYSTYNETYAGWNKTYADTLYVAGANASINALILNNFSYMRTDNASYILSSGTTGYLNSSGSAGFLNSSVSAVNMNITSGNWDLNFTGGGSFNINGGWQNKGVTISGGNVFAQTLYVYNVTSLAVTNLEVNGTITPSAVWNNTFNIGVAGTEEWKYGYFGTDVLVRGQGVWGLFNNFSYLRTDNTSYVLSSGTSGFLNSSGAGGFLNSSGSGGWLNTSGATGFINWSGWTGNTTAIWNATVNQVGIGRPDAKATLHVMTGANIPAILRLESNDSVVTTGDVVGSLQFAEDDATVSYSAAGVRAKISAVMDSLWGETSLVFYTSGSSGGAIDSDVSVERMRINSSGVVGIGVSLNVSSNLYANSTSLRVNVTTSPYLFEVGNTGSNPKAMNVSGLLYVNSTNVGIGVINPNTALEVSGNINATRVNATSDVCVAGGNCLSVMVSGAGSSDFLNSSKSGGFLNSSGSGDFINATGSGGWINSSGSGGFINSSGAGGWINWSGWTGNTTAIWNATVNQVGIGTATPSAQLHVIGNVTISQSLNVSGLLYANSTKVGINTTRPNYLLEINARDTALNVSGLLYVNSTNVGIGTLGSNSMLNIFGASSTTNAINAINALNVTGGSGYTALANGQHGSSGGGIIFGAGAGGSGYSIAVGASNGGAGGDIFLIGKTGGISYTGGVGGGGSSINITAGTGGFGSSSPGGNGGNVSIQSGFNSSGSSNGLAGYLLLNPYGGNVGINTTFPNYLLEINARDKALNVSGNLYVNSTNVGIGTDNPTARLGINQSGSSPTLYGINVSSKNTAGTAYGISVFANSTGGGVAALVYGGKFETFSMAETAGVTGYGIFANATVGGAATGNSYGVYAAAFNGTNAYGIYATAGGVGRNYAGYFDGSVNVIGDEMTICSGACGTQTGAIAAGDLYIEGDLEIDTLGAADATALQIDANGVVTKAVSSERYKTDIQDYFIDTDKLLELRPVKFKWNNNSITPGKESFGLIAEEVYKILPELVYLDSAERPESVHYDKLAVLLLGAYKEQQKTIKEQNKQIKKQQDELEMLKEELCKKNSSYSWCKNK